MNTPLPEALSFHAISAISAIVFRTCRAQFLSSACSQFPVWLPIQLFPSSTAHLPSTQPGICCVTPFAEVVERKLLSEFYLWKSNCEAAETLSASDVPV